ncbi:MAG TPA: alkaline phosphatase family protein [Kofleriaceae bacterium]|nr:alkaline phosphatase family protein [Kofleriaceae bacterium]
MPTALRPVILGLVVGAGCTSGGSGSAADPSTTSTSSCSNLTAQPLSSSPDWQGSVFTIVMENKSQRDILGNKDAPFINSLASQNAVAAGYRDALIHPSEPNYIWMVAGQNFGIRDDNAPIDHHLSTRSHLADQLDMQHVSWKAYMESMGAPCGLVSRYPYEPKHNPFVYFDDLNGWDGTAFQPSQRCTDHVVDYSELDRDLAAGTVPRYVFITPNMVDDMHDGSVAHGDAWLAQELPKILGSDAFNRGGVVFLTWDEGSNNADDPPMIVISPHARRGMVSQTAFDTSSYLKTVQKILGLEMLPCDTANRDSVDSMDELFDVPIDPVART